jgi:hypothetical protein
LLKAELPMPLSLHHVVPLTEGDPLILNQKDFAEIYWGVQDAEMAGRSGDSFMLDWFQSRGLANVSRFFRKITPIRVDPKAERFSVYRADMVRFFA